MRIIPEVFANCEIYIRPPSFSVKCNGQGFTFADRLIFANVYPSDFKGFIYFVYVQLTLNTLFSEFSSLFRYFRWIGHCHQRWDKYIFSQNLNISLKI